MFLKTFTFFLIVIIACTNNVIAEDYIFPENLDISTSCNFSPIEYYLGDTVIINFNLENNTSSNIENFYYALFLPEILSPLVQEVQINGQPLVEYGLELGILGEVYPDSISYRWILDTPSIQRNPIPPSSELEIIASFLALDSGTVGFVPYHFAGMKATDSVSLFGYQGEYGGPLPDVTIGMFPDNQPVIVPAGGYFRYTATIANNTNQYLITDVLVYLVTPGNTIFGPLYQIYDILLFPSFTYTYPGMTQFIPAYAPLGVYKYIAVCGDFPLNPIDTASFEFTVIGQINSGVEDWDLSDWDSEQSERMILESEYSCNIYPNPFNPITEIEYSIPKQSEIGLEIYNIMGQKVETIFNGVRSPGKYSVTWDASNMSSGIYFFKLTSEGKVITKRLTLLK